MKKFLQLFLILCLSVQASFVSADGNPMVTIKLQNYIQNQTELTFRVEGSFSTLSPTLSIKEGVNYTLLVQDGNLFIQEGKKKKYPLQHDFILIPEAIQEGHLVYINDRPYMGAMRFTLEKDTYIRPFNQLPLEEYLKGVVPNEVFPSWKINALKAQTVAARTYAYIHANSGKEMDDTTRFQVYGGYTPFPNTNKAVEETKGEIITYEGKPINALYSASNGGITESSHNVWGGQGEEYFPIKEDPYDPKRPWKIILYKEQVPYTQLIFGAYVNWLNVEERNKHIATNMQNWLKNKGYINPKIISINKFEVSEEKTESNRAVKGSISFTFMHQPFGDMVFFEEASLEDVPIAKIRKLIGGTIFKSFFIEAIHDVKGIYVVSGKGYGHGVGMSQWGASVMAEKNIDYKNILQFYYPGTEITNIP